ncbi:MAG: prepilin-type N-terminal cleavage/methylation domain-containing protein [Candidatus Taylorbacteria bacterium]|nr:prepilin-type N-terminal cleavage/methylation domain-containing protein [Candidatus Taylorbacteria bacterium]
MRRGFSLIEMIIYIAIVSATFLLVVNVCLTISRSYTTLRNAKNIQDAVSLGFESIVREIRDASNVDLSESNMGVNDGRLALNTIYNNVPSVVEFYLSSTTLYMERDNVVQGPLTSKGVSVTNLKFEYMATSTSHAVKINMTVNGNDFYDTIVLRGSYK